MSYVFVKADVCWADEFDCEMFGVFPKEEWDELVADTKIRLDKWKAKQEAESKKRKDTYYYGDELEIGFGTNESLTVSSFEDWNREFQVEDITEEEARILRKLFCPSYKTDNSSFTWGTGDGFFTSIIEILNEEGESV